MVCVLNSMSDGYSLDELSRQSAAVADVTEGTTSLVLLRLIEETVGNLGSTCKTMKGLIEMNSLTASQIESRVPETGAFLDPEDAVISTLEQVIESLEGKFPTLLRKKSSIDRDAELSAAHREFLHSAYDECLAVTGDLIEAVKDLRGAIIKHDLAAAPRTGLSRYTSASDLVAALRRA